MANTAVSIRLDDNTQASLKKLSNSRDRSPHYLMKEAVESYLKREESIEVEKALLKSRWENLNLQVELSLIQT